MTNTTRSPFRVEGCFVSFAENLHFCFFSCLALRLSIHSDVIARYRIMHRVSMEEHNTLLKGRGWTEEEFEAGFRQGVPPRQGSEHFIQYEAMVQRELAKGEVSKREKRREKREAT